MTDSSPSLLEISAKLDIIFTQMGDQAATEFLKVCSRTLNDAHATLAQYIDQQDWESAKILIHRLLGTANLYASKTLLQVLETIDKHDISEQNISLNLLQLQTELAITLTQMTNRLALYSDN